MSELRQKFEELPDIKGIIYGSDFGFNESLNQYYHPDHTNHRLNYAFIMGAWYAFQEQQKKIDEIVSIVRDADLSDGDSSVAIVHDEIQELLK